MTPALGTEESARELYSDLVPPRRLGSAGDGAPEYSSIGDTGARCFRLLTERGGLRPTDRVLEVGCAGGRMAIQLIPYLRDQGRYEGFDISPIGITWCSRKIAEKFPRFRFHLADVHNRRFNPIGRHKACEYQFPYQDSFFDFVFLTSIFAHMLPLDMGGFLKEIARVLRPDGRCLISWLLLNAESRALNDQSAAWLKYEVGKARLHVETMPERFIGYDEELVLGLYRQVGLELVQPVHYGSWCGRTKFLDYHDIILARKSDQPQSVPGSAGAELAEEMVQLQKEIDSLSNRADRPARALAGFFEQALHIVPDETGLIVAGVSGAELKDFGRRRVWSLPEWERPDEFPRDPARAIERLETSRVNGAGYLLFAPRAFHLLRDHSDFRRELDRLYWCLAFNESCIAYQFDEPPQEIEMETIKIAMTQSGVLDSEAGAEIVGGWAWDSSQPDSAIDVEVYDGAEKVATVRADEFRQDLVDAGIGNGKHGFSFEPPASMRDSAAHSVSVKIAGSGIHLANSPMEFRIDEPPLEADIETAMTQSGVLDFEPGAEIVGGWAWDRSQPDSPVDVEVYDGDEKVATVRADEFRQDLVDAGIGNGRHGFSYEPPPSMRDSAAHSLSVKIAGSGIHLANSPVEFRFDEPPQETDIETAMTQSGVVDSEPGAEIVGGWAWDSSQPDSPVDLDVYDGDEKVATVRADEFRQDLVDAGIGNGKHGFSYEPPASMRDSAAHSLSVKIAGSGIHLTNSPMEFRVREQADVLGVVDECTAAYVAGWVWDRRRPDAPLVVDIYDGQELIAQVTASILREDLRDAGYGNGKHGFACELDPTLETGRPHAVSVKVSGSDVHLENSPIVLGNAQTT